MRIDLHVHSNYSDGSLTPKELVTAAAAQGLAAFALTDHDTVGGVKEAVEAAKDTSVQVIPGIELSCSYQGTEIHMLGYQVDIGHKEFLDRLESYRLDRERRNLEMIERMREYGLPIDRDSFFARYPVSVITRAHFAEYLLETGVVSTIQEAFDRYVGDGKPCYLPKKAISCEEAISCIRLGKGHPVLAHPFQYHMSLSELEVLTRELIGYGLEGMEVIYSTYNDGQERSLRTLAGKLGLQITGGSDFHGSKKKDIQLGTGRGSLYVHHDVMEWLL